MKLQIDYCIVDVKHGRKNLKKKIDAGEKVEIAIYGTIDDICSHDDGVSREFCVSVDRVDVCGKDDKRRKERK